MRASPHFASTFNRKVIYPNIFFFEPLNEKIVRNKTNVSTCLCLPFDIHSREACEQTLQCEVPKPDHNDKSHIFSRDHNGDNLLYVSILTRSRVNTDYESF